MNPKERLDKLLVERGLVASRERARALIMEGRVMVDGHPATKAGEMVGSEAQVSIKGGDMPYVSRGGLKLEAAIRQFGISLKDKAAMDVGASTGGFTDVMLQLDARKVYCIDVGYGQLAWKLRQDPRVSLLERTNIRNLERNQIPETVDIATIDVSFISLIKVMPKVLEFLKSGGEIVALIKPQFEVGRGEVGKGGIVRDESKRIEALERLKVEFELLGLRIIGVIESPILGQKGNVEYLLYAKK
ncbi:MAG TPA: TlyA family RNA methyltransferase [Dissulfurispiraceae bacterium]|nr:TlyA family RNA methyltransferase [Dissulfurispiraceae bacterium]